jgi:hypothetical protein
MVVVVVELGKGEKEELCEKIFKFPRNFKLK